MPKRQTKTKAGTHQALKNISFESRVVAWLMYDGWQVFTPVVDNGHQTDILVSDGPEYYRIQIKTVDAATADEPFENRWKDSHVDFVVAFARNSNWGYVFKAFSQNRKKLNAQGHEMFMQNRRDFLKAFHKV